MNRFYLPVMERMTVTDYSLYQCPLVIDFSPKLNIIFGTNGTGKSTLLMMILFSIVGLYSGNIKTKTRQEQRRDNRPLHEESFFRDRMGDAQETAAVRAEFTIQDDRFVVTHSLTDGKLLSVELNQKALTGELINYKKYERLYTRQRASDLPEEKLDDFLITSYHEQLKKSTGLPGGINTLISMLLDVMFFDEGRKLTFWNKDLQETIVGKYIVDPTFYEKYCEQKLTVRALESAYKKKSETWNYMNKFFEREKEQSSSVSLQKNIDPYRQRDQIEERIGKLEEDLQKDQSEYLRMNSDLLREAKLEEEIKDKLAVLENEWYSNLLPDQYRMYHDRFSKKMIEGLCPICNQKHRFSLSVEKCILCGEKIELRDLADITAIDSARQEASQELAEAKNRVEQIRKELHGMQRDIEKIRKEIDSLNVRKDEICALLNPDEDHSANSDRKRLERARAERERALVELKKARQEEENMRRVIEDSLAENFSIFRRTFLRYASSFFGPRHEENISLPFSSTEEDVEETPLMKFELDGKGREKEYMLSESQRIFTDLSFRFAILTTFHETSFFMCETPDSTLDMFHEAQAVKTFEEYIDKGNMLILSANARRSSLINNLYQKYGKAAVTVIDLTKLSRLALPESISFSSYVEEV